jgi:hypothetical protein
MRLLADENVTTKSHLRPTDEALFAALLPLLTKRQRAWLRETVSRVYVGEHPWIGRESLGGERG